MIHLTLVAAIIFCAYRAMRAARLINVTIWLAGTSALTSVLIYLLGAPEVAVIELSVGAGLVTVLFVFAFSITGETTIDENTLVPRWLIWGLGLIVVLILGWLILPVRKEVTLLIRTDIPIAFEPNFGHMLWQQRGLDVVVQMVLIFAGVMGLLGLLSTSGPGFQRTQRETTVTVSKEDQSTLGDVVNREAPGMETPNGNHQTVAEATQETAPEEVRE
jgi:uncharacterized MnhB-related membrane protein